MTGYKVPKSTVEHLKRRMLDIGSVHTLEKRHYASGLQEAIHAIEESPEEELDNPWHTGTPTEEGDYLVKLDVEHNVYPYYVLKWNKKGWYSHYDMDYPACPQHSVLKWQKIEPYEEESK